MEYPEAVWVPITPTGTMSSGLLASTIDTITRTALGSGGFIPLDRYPQTLTNTDILTFQTAAADVAFDQTYVWIPEATGMVNKFFINIGMIMSMTAWTDNQNVWDTVQVTITRQGGDDVIFDRTYAVGQSVGAIGHHLFLIADSVTETPIRIRAGNPLEIHIRTTNTKTITNISSFGLMPFYPQQKPASAADPLFWTHSGILWFISRDRRN